MQGGMNLQGEMAGVEDSIRIMCDFRPVLVRSQGVMASCAGAEYVSELV